MSEKKSSKCENMKTFMKHKIACDVFTQQRIVLSSILCVWNEIKQTTFVTQETHKMLLIKTNS